MTNAIGAHQPTAEFRSLLEEELSRALRREELSFRSLNTGGHRRFLFAGSLAATLAIGVVLGAAPAQIQDARQRSALVILAESEVRLALTRVEIARGNYELATKRFDTGMIARTSLTAAEGELRSMESKLAAARLNVEEIEATSTSPRNDLGAPLVGRGAAQRDFVKERLQLELVSTQNLLSAAEREAEIAQQRRQLAAVTGLVVDEALTEVARAKAHMETIAGRIALRQAFFDQRLSPAEVERQAQVLTLQHDLVIAQRQRGLADQRHSLARARHEAGAITRGELLKAELEVIERATDVERITVSLQMLEAAGKGRGGAE